MKDPRDVILAPVVSEKSYTAIDSHVYTFLVHPDSSKPEIKDAVQRIFEVKVLRVNTMWRHGKRKRNWRSGRYGVRNRQKRAVVQLAPGEKIDIFQPR